MHPRETIVSRKRLRNPLRNFRPGRFRQAAIELVTRASAEQSLHPTPIKMKNKVQHLLVLAAAAATVGFFANSAAAQGFDPAEVRARQLDNYRESIGVKSEEDWKKLEPLVGKVMDAQTAARMGARFGFGGRGGRGGGGGGGGGGGEGRDRNRGQTNPEREALQKAIEEKAPADEVKAKLAKYRDARKEKETAVEKAQEELRKALTPTQEGGAVLAGLLK